ncbi:DUF805 domain-containing protein [Myxococcota bacterium]|nr:DUF805 domain-containing protein [Myxococcota bacterium]MBU1382343.1 DUF805 domain-containing protein [Myxococcota bacterium]MBU1496658.1 DUF805 domain-containing protein [Myxococcota bacterium]
MDWFFKALSKYFVFEGRARRKEYWYFLLFDLLIIIIAGLLDLSLGMQFGENPYGPISALVMLALFIPTIAVSVRRLHDLGIHGAVYLINIIPLIGALIFSIIACFPGKRGSNKYGGDPIKRKKSKKSMVES